MINVSDLQTITYSITYHCNLACSWCFQNSSSEIPYEFDFEFRKNILHKIGSKDRSITLTGGEPFAYPHILPLLNEAISCFNRVGVTTNGIYFSNDQFRFIEYHHIPLAISLDGPEFIHDQVRGKGSFQKTLNNIQILLTKNIPVTVQVILSQRIVHYLDQFLEQMDKYGIKKIAFQRLQHEGRGKDFLGDQFSKEEALEMAKHINSLSDQYKGCLRIKTKDPLYRTIDENLKSHSLEFKSAVISGCRAGMSYLYIDIDGTVLACPYLPIPLGNVIQQPIEEIWLNAPLLKQLRKRSAYAVCNTCPNWGICRGCRACAYSENGDPLGRDPLCWNSNELEKICLRE